MSKVYLPEDTRLIEMLSAVSFIWGGIFLSFDMVQVVGAGQPNVVLSAMFLCFGSLQFIGAVQELVALRITTALMAGGMWVWSGISGIGGDTSINDFPSWWLGIACLYSFIVNSLRRKPIEVVRE